MLLFSSLSILSITYKCTIKYWRFQSTKRSSQKLTGLYTFKQFLNCCFSFRTSFFHPASSEHAAPCVFFFLYKQNSFPIKMKKMKSDRLFFLAMDFCCCCFRLVSLFSWRDGDFVLREIFSVVFWQEGKTTLCHWMLLVALLWQKRETPLQKQNQIWTGINCLWLSGICIVKSTDGVLLFSYLSKTLFFFPHLKLNCHLNSFNSCSHRRPWQLKSEPEGKFVAMDDSEPHSHWHEQAPRCRELASRLKLQLNYKYFCFRNFSPKNCVHKWFIHFSFCFSFQNLKRIFIQNSRNTWQI